MRDSRKRSSGDPGKPLPGDRRRTNAAKMVKKHGSSLQNGKEKLYEF
jgi:hypothetical protein